MTKEHYDEEDQEQEHYVSGCTWGFCWLWVRLGVASLRLRCLSALWWSIVNASTTISRIKGDRNDDCLPGYAVDESDFRLDSVVGGPCDRDWDDVVVWVMAISAPLHPKGLIIDAFLHVEVRKWVDDKLPGPRELAEFHPVPVLPVDEESSDQSDVKGK